MLQVEKISELAPERRSAIMTRSMADVASVFMDVRALVDSVRQSGDRAVLAQHLKEYHEETTADRLKATDDEFRPLTIR
jgi:histidinol dehydrogenase